jgi:hypothetical protein
MRGDRSNAVRRARCGVEGERREERWRESDEERGCASLEDWTGDGTQN